MGPSCPPRPRARSTPLRQLLFRLSTRFCNSLIVTPADNLPHPGAARCAEDDVAAPLVYEELGNLGAGRGSAFQILVWWRARDRDAPRREKTHQEAHTSAPYARSPKL